MKPGLLVVTLLLPALVLAGAHTGAGKPTGGEVVSYIHAGKLLAVPGEAPRENVTVIVEGERIKAIHDGFMMPSGEPGSSRVIYLKDHFVLPGLMDAHVHLGRASGAFQRRSRATDRRETNADRTVNAIINARLNLAAGFTTLRDVGSDEESVFAVRDAINAGKMLGPTILASGQSISVTGGHGDDSTSADPDERARAGVCDGPDECRTLVRHLKRIGADLIKYKSTGGFASNTGLSQHMFAEEMTAIVATAHQRGMQVATHAYDAAAIKDAIRAGVDSIEHGFLLDDEGIRMMKDRSVFLVPTITIARPPSIAFRFVPEEEALSSVRLRDEYAAFERAYNAGVKIAFGTDVGVYPHGENADELVTMVSKGMSEMDAIVAATVHTAELFGLSDTSGTIEAGKYADIIAATGNPLEDIAALKNVDFVLKRGRVAKQGGKVTLPLRYDLEHTY
jgi:imidazolonepropionase-like amidohydrolase